jgi:transcription initiation factor IIF auxiliary subunit
MKIAQSENYQGDDWWKWAIWIDCPPEELASIESVTYRLHPTFSNPVRKIADRSSKFRLETEGWGTFTIYAEVEIKNGTPRKLRHELQLHYPSGQATTA